MNTCFLRLLSLLLALLTCAGILSACGAPAEDRSPESRPEETAAPETGSGSDTETERVSRFNELPAADYGEEEFVILTKNITGSNMWDPLDICAEDMTGDLVTDAIYERNKMVEEKYRISIVQFDDANYESTVSTSVSTNSTEFDVVDVNLITTLGTFATKGYLTDLHTLEGMDLRQSYWDGKVNANIEIRDRLYAAVSEITFIDDYATWCLLFNKKRATDVGITPSDLYDLAAAGKWTTEDLYDYAEQALRDINGDGMDPLDYWGIYTQYEAVNPLLASTGLTAVVRNEQGELVSNLGNPELLDAVEALYEYMSDKTVQLYAEDTGFSDVWNRVKAQFAGGYGLFFICPVGNIDLSYLREMEEEYGILPLPKLDESQEYATTMQYNNATAVAVLTSTSSTERAGVILEAMGAASSETLTVAFYEKVLTRKRVRDSESAAMLDLIFRNKVVDTALLYNWANIGGMFQRIMKAGSFTYASEAAGIAESFEEAIRTTVEAFGG